MSHTITITKLPDDVDDDVVYSIGGAHDYTCSVLIPCKLKRCQGLKRDYDWGDERIAHGLEHEYRDGEWLVEDPNGCGVRWAYDLNNEVEYFGRLGTFPLELRWDDDWYAQPIEAS